MEFDEPYDQLSQVELFHTLKFFAFKWPANDSDHYEVTKYDLIDLETELNWTR